MFKLKDIELSFSWRTVTLASLVFIWLSLFLLSSLLSKEIPAMKQFGMYVSYEEEPTIYILTFATYAFFWLASLFYIALSIFKYNKKETTKNIDKKKRKRK